MLVMAASMSASLGLGLVLSRALTAMIMPLWQKPHWGTSSLAQAFCTGWLPFLDRPSMVTIFSLPVSEASGRTQLRVATPSMCTVQAPHWAMPQPYLVPVMLSCSRSTHSSGVSASASTSRTLPLTLSFAMRVSSGEWIARVRQCHPGSNRFIEDFVWSCLGSPACVRTGGSGPVAPACCRGRVQAGWGSAVELLARLVQPHLQAVQQVVLAEGAAFLGKQGAGFQAVQQVE